MRMRRDQIWGAINSKLGVEKEEEREKREWNVTLQDSVATANPDKNALQPRFFYLTTSIKWTFSVPLSALPHSPWIFDVSSFSTMNLLGDFATFPYLLLGPHSGEIRYTVCPKRTTRVWMGHAVKRWQDRWKLFSLLAGKKWVRERWKFIHI